VLDHLSTRVVQSLASKIKALSGSEHNTTETVLPKNSRVVFTSSSDCGVVRNGGRKGSRFAPQAIINSLGKMVDHFDHPIFTHELAQCFDFYSDQKFNEAQNISAGKCLETLKRGPHTSVHLGGGQDHILPFLMALEASGHDQIIVLNIDPHLDTRLDPIRHSGTPFRDFAELTKSEFSILQLGTCEHSNSPESYQALKNGRMKIISFNDILREGQYFRKSIIPLIQSQLEKVLFTENCAFMLSIDCDAIDHGTMSAVSAVSQHGFPISCIVELLSWYKAFSHKNKYLGIYEYNPLFEDLSNKGARAISSLLYQYLK
jgi:formiminoglutamase